MIREEDKEEGEEAMIEVERGGEEGEVLSSGLVPHPRPKTSFLFFCFSQQAPEYRNL